MKKRIIIVSFFICSFLMFASSSEAKGFNENQLASKFDLYIYSSKMHLRKNFKKITDEEGVPLYEISPTISNFSNLKDYELKLSSLEKEQKEMLSKILYFGYGYNHQNSDSYYFATQYLVYKTFSTVNTTYDLINLDSNYMTKEIEEIENKIKSVSFSLKDFTTDSTIYSIEDKYIIDNFTILGEDVKISNEEEKIKLEFLGDKENYILYFHPKNKCQDTYVWTTTNIELLSRGTVCEKEYKVMVQIKKENPENNKSEEKEEENKEESTNGSEKEEIKPPKEENKEESTNSSDGEELRESDFFDEDTIQISVPVPNTAKKNFFLLEIICFLGSLYFVFKK